VFHISYKFTGKHDEAEDLTQEIFLKVFRSLDKFNRDADFSTWLSSVARNYCIDHYRASKREKEVVVEDALAYDLAPASSGNPYRALEDQDRRSLVRRGLEQLPGSCGRRSFCAICRGSATRRWRCGSPSRRGRSRAASTGAARSSRGCCSAPSSPRGGAPDHASAGGGR
jgi:hypothetical protein